MTSILSLATDQAGRHGRARCSYQRALRWLAIGSVLLGPLAVVAGTEQASAAPLPPNCIASSTEATCTFLPGSEGTFVVPTSAPSLHVVASGGSGGTIFYGVGGPGAQVTADLNGTNLGGRLYSSRSGLAAEPGRTLQAEAVANRMSGPARLTTLAARQ
jgi:hypothetical protein